MSKRICRWYGFMPVGHDWQAHFETMPNSERERLPNGRLRLYAARITHEYCRSCGATRNPRPGDEQYRAWEVAS